MCKMAKHARVSETWHDEMEDLIIDYKSKDYAEPVERIVECGRPVGMLSMRVTSLRGVLNVTWWAPDNLGIVVLNKDRTVWLTFARDLEGHFCCLDRPASGRGAKALAVFL